MDTILLTLSCADRVGLLAETTGFCANRGLNLLEAHQFTDADNGWFFTRLEMQPTGAFQGLERLRVDLEQFATVIDARRMLRRKEVRHRVALLVSREGRCLADLLWRWRSGDLAMDPAGVVSPPDMCERWEGHMINIHHSFLPAFAGAQPYRQAHERGAKLIGATCHYVTPALDAGPIIDQEVTRVEHFHSWHDLVCLGQDCERLALLRGLHYHLEDRVLVHRGRTIVFRD
jgi:formyltetrahydrofolate deformylase